MEGGPWRDLDDRNDLGSANRPYIGLSARPVILPAPTIHAHTIPQDTRLAYANGLVPAFYRYDSNPQCP